MSFLTDLIKEKAGEVLADKISIPEGIQEEVSRKLPAKKAVSTN